MASHSGSELRVLEVDPMLQSHAEHLRYRYQQYQNTRGSIERHAGSLLNFARGAKDYGIHTTDELTVYREWAPAAQAAQLIGDFNGWKPLDMSLGDNGVWFIELPHGPGGAPAIPHGALVKVRLRLPGGEWVDRIPAWIKWAVVPQGEMGAKYVGVHWAPTEAHAWVHPRPPRPATLRIYEAHVGMSSEERAVASYTYFKDSVLPHIHASGYNAIQLMAIQEHAYYGSFGYHVTNPFAASSRSGTPEELKALIDAAHGLGIVVLLDVVHSHISSNCEDGLAGFDFGQGPDENYFLQGDRGYHKEWDSRLFNYAGYETLRYLLSNLHYWIQDMGFDGFRFDGVTSMLYHHHGIGIGFTGNYSEYFSPSTNIDALVYLMLANDMVHELLPSAITIAEDVSGAPTLCRPVGEGGVGFDYRLAMGEPDFWVRTVKQVADEDWSMTAMASALCDRRYSEATVGYVESHDQALVGDQTLAFQLMGTEMYTSMSARQHPLPPRIERGIALHKLIRLITMCLGGESYLNFMGNEFGHPDWIDFPREGNGWSYEHCRRLWSLLQSDDLLYPALGRWDAACMALDQKGGFIASRHQWVTLADDARQVLVAERGPYLFVFNWSPSTSYQGLEVPAPRPGKYRPVLDSDAREFGGQGRVDGATEHFSQPRAPQVHGRDQALMVMVPARCVAVYECMDG
ncbi:SBE1 [Auxenochlorella protothecoides x Auxenochlorella symbiontica]